jgi:predicted acylesterase/phospholipase RssA
MSDALERLRRARRVGFLFSGGAARCAFQVGVVETLYAHGIEPAMCLGVSVGVWNAAAVAAGNWRRLRHYWRFFCRMPAVDLRNLLAPDGHSPFIWPRLHARAFRRYVTAERIANGLPLYVSLTRLRDRKNVIADVKAAADPFRILLASNYLPPFYTHSPLIDGERYGDGAWSNNAPYEALLERGCDMVVLMASKGESEGGLYRNNLDYEHGIPAHLADRVIVIRPRHRIPLGFIDRRWENIAPIAELGALRAREVLLGERHAGTELAARGKAFTAHVARIRRILTR